MSDNKRTRSGRAVKTPARFDDDVIEVPKKGTTAVDTAATKAKPETKPKSQPEAKASVKEGAAAEEKERTKNKVTKDKAKKKPATARALTEILEASKMSPKQDKAKGKAVDLPKDREIVPTNETPAEEQEAPKRDKGKGKATAPPDDADEATVAAPSTTPKSGQGKRKAAVVSEGQDESASAESSRAYVRRSARVAAWTAPPERNYDSSYNRDMYGTQRIDHTRRLPWGMLAHNALNTPIWPADEPLPRNLMPRGQFPLSDERESAQMDATIMARMEENEAAERRNEQYRRDRETYERRRARFAREREEDNGNGNGNGDGKEMSKKK